MPSDRDISVQGEYTPEFKRNVRALAKKYRHIRSDIQPIIDRIQAGEFIGEQVTGIRHAVYKVRVQNRDIQRGKSAGYRLIYCLKTPEKVILITVYSKLEQSDVSAEKLRRILVEFEDHSAQ
jgi:mRNA-degrading endonuclease RelE of RelBE toxin-antitoxin system